MEKDLQVVDIWKEFKIDHLANGAFFLSNYVIIELLAMSPIDCFSHEMEGTAVIIEIETTVFHSRYSAPYTRCTLSSLKILTCNYNTCCSSP